MSFLLFKEIRRVFQAELLRHLRVAPGSTLMATLVFPFVTILALNTLPRVQSAGLFQLQRAVWSLETFELPASETHDDHAVPTPLPPPLAPVLGLKPPPPLPPLLTAEDAACPWLDAPASSLFTSLSGCPTPVPRLSGRKWGWPCSSRWGWSRPNLAPSSWRS